MSRNKRAGTAWEREIVDYAIGRGHWGAERRALAGSNDRGDVVGLTDLVVEAKNERSIEWAAGVDEAEREASNAGTRYFVAVFKRRRKNVAEAYAATKLGNFLAMYEELLELRRQLRELRAQQVVSRP
jgi:hypothetical protein